MHTRAGALATSTTASYARSACTYILGSSTPTSLACGQVFLRVCGTIWACAEQNLSFEIYFAISSSVLLRFWSDSGERQIFARRLVCSCRRALDSPEEKSIGRHFRE